MKEKVDISRLFDRMFQKKHLLLLIPFLYFGWIALRSSQFAGGEDGVMHHLFARYVPQHPANLLDHWAKPLYVLLSTPFAQFGFTGSLFFNIVLSVATAYFLWRTADVLKLSFSWIAPAMLFGSTLYFFCVSSAITEILFSFLLAWGLYEASKKRYIPFAIILSFLPFARSEGNGILAIALVGLLYLRAWKAIPFLALGTVVYSIAGSFHFNDLFWVWNNHPYRDASDIYGRGTWYHYVDDPKGIWGIPLFILMCLATLGFAWVIIRNLFKKKLPNEPKAFWLFFVFGSFFTYLVGHSLVWYLGKSASLGLIRVMAAVMPASVLMGHWAFHQIINRLNPNLNIAKSVLAVLLGFICIRGAIHLNKPPYTGDWERQEILKAGDWFRQSPYFESKSKVYYFAPSMADAFVVNPFDPTQRGELSDVVKIAPEEIPSGSIIIWDAHFGPNECRTPVEDIKSLKHLELIYHQVPENPFTTLNGYPYEIYLFRKP